MRTTSPAANVQDSKAQRQERLKSRFRDRGGIFVPSEGNPLVDILLARGVNGESPIKRRAPRKSAVTPKPRSSSSKKKTPRTGASKRAPRKLAVVASAGDENYPPSMKKRRDRSRTPKLQVSKGMVTCASAGLSQPHAAAQRMPYADQVAAAIRPAAVLPPRFSDEPKHPGEEHVSKSTKRPALILDERQGQERHDGRAEGQEFAAPKIKQVNGTGVKAMRLPLVHDQSGSRSNSGVSLAMKHAAVKPKRSRSLAGTRSKPKTNKEEGSPLLTKKRGGSKVKAPPRPSVAEKGDVEPETVPLASSRRRKVAPNANPYPPTTTITHIAVDSGGVGREAQEIAPAPAKGPRKRKERVKASVDKDDNNNDGEHEYENTHGLPQRKRRRADLTVSRNAKENKEMNRLAREGAAKMDKLLPSPMKKLTRATPKPSSNAKEKAKTKTKTKTAKSRSRAGTSTKSGTRPRGLPLDVRRRIEVIAQNLLATDFDDDDPIDFLR